MLMCSMPSARRAGVDVIPASKRRRGNNTTSATGFVRSLRDMFERPREQTKPAVESDSESVDALDNELSQKDDKQ